MKPTIYYVDSLAGSGKTTQMIQTLDDRPTCIVVPTKELADQIHTTMMHNGIYGDVVYGSDGKVLKSEIITAANRNKHMVITHAGYILHHKHVDGMRVIIDELPIHECSYILNPFEEYLYRTRSYDIIKQVESRPLKGMMKRLRYGGYIDITDGEDLISKPKRIKDGYVPVKIRDLDKVDESDFVDFGCGVFLAKMDILKKYKDKRSNGRRAVQRIKGFAILEDDITKKYHHKLVLNPRIFDGVTMMSALFTRSSFYHQYKQYVNFVPSNEIKVDQYIPQNPMVIHFYMTKKASKTMLTKDKSVLTRKLIRAMGGGIVVTHKKSKEDLKTFVNIMNLTTLKPTNDEKKYQIVSMISHGLNKYATYHNVGCFFALRENPTVPKPLRASQTDLDDVECHIMYQAMMRSALRDRDDDGLVNIHVMSLDQAERLAKLCRDIGMSDVVIQKAEL